jgi:hypothetical protein
MSEYILGNLERHPLRGDSMGPIGKEMRGWLGHAVIAMPLEAHVKLNYTGPIGSVLGIYYALIFQLGKWEYNVQKADEWVEVSPVHAQYYQLTQKQKEDLEGKIKQGLGSVSQNVADMELLMHDKRRYLEFLHYMGYRTYKEANHKTGANTNPDELVLDEDDAKVHKRMDQHSLKAVFIDQVDIHTGEGISMRSIVSRWPTLITDFMGMVDDDMEPDKIMKKLNVSRAESIVLITKNKLYQEWKKVFGPEIKQRYKRINQLLQSREESVNQYREWLKPLVARHKLIKEGLASAGGRSAALTSQFTMGGSATSAAEVKLFVWKDFIVPEIFKGGSEEMGKLLQMDKLKVDDDWTKKNLIFGKKYGLINQHDWITEEWVAEQKKKMFADRWLTPHKPYYSFFVISMMRSTARFPDGGEIDDGVFDVNMIFMSQNAAFVKMLELKAKQQEMEDYIDGLIGVKNAVAGKRPGYSEEKENPVLDFFSKVNIPLKFSKGGPYERDFEDRITKICLARCAQERYGPIVGFLKKKMGMV